MAWEQAAADSLSLNWDVRVFLPNFGMLNPSDERLNQTIAQRDIRSFPQKLLDWRKLRKKYYSRLLSIEDDYDVFLLRYSLHDPFQNAFIKKTTKPVWTVHHTLEVPVLSCTRSIVGRARAWAESNIGRNTLEHVQGVIGVTDEIVGYELSRVATSQLSSAVYPNGIIYSNFVAADERTKIPELIFIASDFYPWQGLDLLLSELENNTDDLVLHLVGHLSKGDQNRVNRDSRVKFHGYLSRDQIQSLICRSSVGLTALALERKNMKQACTLKAREYLMMGLPVYSGHTDVFPTEFPYYRCGPVDLAAIL